MCGQLRAIEAESENSYTWDLWAKVHSTLGQEDASLAVRWESIRRFPENCVLRSSLAHTLMEHDRLALAENLLRETMRVFPDDIFCRNILASLLIRTEREEAAESLLRETMRDFRGDIVSRHILTRMLWQQGRQNQAEAEVAMLEALASDNAHVKTLAARIRQPRGDAGGTRPKSSHR